MRRSPFLIMGLFSVCLFVVSSVPAQEQQQPPIQEEVIVRWWLVPVYAVDKAGLPILDLSPEDLEVYIGGQRVDPFSLHKKRFEVTEAPKQKGTPARASQQPAQRKLVFLIFDTAFSPYNLLAKAKSIARTVIAQSDGSAQYVLLSIEPFAGLTYIYGPTQNLDLLSKNMEKHIAGKKADYLQTSAMDNSTIRDPYPPGDARNPSSGGWGTLGSGAVRQYSALGVDSLGRITGRDKKRLAASYASALMTLSAVLGTFREYSKVVYLYSCGIPSEALLNRTEWVSKPAAAPNEPPEYTVALSPDMVAYDTLTMIGRHLNTSGALLFLVNPSGTRVDENDRDSGEHSLRILADESGGRYFEGAEKDVAREVNRMEGGYYEISFPDKPEYEGQELGFEIRSHSPDVQIFTVKKVGREKSYAEMTELEREVVILNILNDGPFANARQKVSFVEATDILRDGPRLICQMPLPPELARSGWTVFKIARCFNTGAIFIEKDSLVPSGPSIQVHAKWRGDEFRHDIVLAHTKTGTILVWK